MRLLTLQSSGVLEDLSGVKIEIGEGHRKSSSVLPEATSGAYLLPVAPQTVVVGPKTTDVLPERFTLEEAVACRTFPAADPADLPDIPPALVDALKKASTVLLIGHINPDADCVGSTLALARALRAIGKRVDVCVDDELSAQLRRVDDESQVRRAADLQGRNWDLAIVMDTMVPERVGGALQLLGRAEKVGVVDHHEGEVDPAVLGVRDDQPFHVWINADYSAAAMMSAGLIGRLGPRLSARVRPSVYEPALAGFATDVGFGEHPALHREDFAYFKHMIGQTHTTVAALRDRLTVPPPAAVAALIRDPAADVSLPADLAARLDELRARGDVVTHDRFDGGTLPLTVISCPGDYFDLLLDIGRIEQPDFNRIDLNIAFKEQRDVNVRNVGGVGAVLFERPQRTTVSLRSADGDHAHRLATSFGGGGHKTSAAARAWGQSAQAVSRSLRAQLGIR